MFEGLFIRKANFDRVSSTLKKEHFIFTKKDVEDLLKGNQKGVRYGNMVLARDESGVVQKRFLKILLDGKWKTYRLFKRQVLISTALHEDKNFPSPTMTVIRSSLTPPVPYAIFETREDGEGFGFMHDNPLFYERFTKEEMRRLVEVLFLFHESGFTINDETLALTQNISSRLKDYKKECKKLLDTRVTHRMKEGTEITEKVEQLLITYTGMQDVRERIMKTLEKNFAHVDSSKTTKGFYLVHADMQIDNVYRHKDGNFELLDFEWVGRSDNPAIPIMFDYGNLRARAWSSPVFQKMLDEAMVEVGATFHPKSKDMIQAAMNLGILRSSLLMARFHLDVVNTIKKDKRSEEDYHAMHPRTVSALKSVLE